MAPAAERHTKFLRRRKPELPEASRCQPQEPRGICTHPSEGFGQAHAIIFRFSKSVEQCRFAKTDIWVMALVAAVEFVAYQARLCTIVVRRIKRHSQICSCNKRAELVIISSTPAENRCCKNGDEDNAAFDRGRRKRPGPV